MVKILIGSPIKQQYSILKVFLENIIKMELNNIDVTYFFIDDNVEEKSTKLLQEFKKQNNNVILKNYQDYGYLKGDQYKNDENHLWRKSLINRITDFKDDIIHYAQENNFDYLFFVDSDIIMNPKTITHLIKQNVDIVSEVFWTSWSIGDTLSAQVWLQDECNLYVRNWDKDYTNVEIKQYTKDFVAKLKIPGLYEVGGLGACTLISKYALSKDLSFKCIPNVSFWGEDRHFCIRAEVLGLKLYVDTFYPAYHIYREDYLEGVDNYIKNGFDPNKFVYNPLERKKIQLKKTDKKEIINSKFDDYKALYKELKKSLFLKKRVVKEEPKITLSMVVCNEGDSNLEQTLKQAQKYVDNFVIIDNASTDNTIDMVKSLIDEEKLTLITNSKSLNAQELRKLQWNETIKTNPDWILFLDSNKMFEENFARNVKYMVENNEVDVYCFQVYDNNSNSKTNVVYPGLMRYQHKFKYKFDKDNIIPKNILNLNYINSDIKLFQNNINM